MIMTLMILLVLLAVQMKILMDFLIALKVFTYQTAGKPSFLLGNEACFYQEMSWVDGSGTASADAIKADMAGLDAGLKGDFDGNIDACAAWSGSVG